MWVWPDAAEGARFHAFSSSVCATGPGHSTCEADCKLFGGDCSMGARGTAFGVDKTGNARISAEGLCGANMCYTDGHCGAMLDPERKYMGIGFADNGKSNGVDYLYVDNGPENDFPVPIATHFDERIKVNGDDLNSGGKHLIFQAIYYHKTMGVKTASVHYKGEKFDMTKVFGTEKRALYEFAAEIPTGCEPYYFEFETTSNTVVRMPESADYFFGTAWSKWEWWQPGKENFPANCQENHYYRQKDGNIVANGGPNKAGESTCVGCSKVAALETSNPEVVAPETTAPSPEATKQVETAPSPVPESEKEVVPAPTSRLRCNRIR